MSVISVVKPGIAWLLPLVLVVVALSLRGQADPIPWPQSELQMFATGEVVSGADLFQGEAALVNLWASWCVACRDELPLLKELSAEYGIPVHGVNYQDDPADAMRWIDFYGDPFAISVKDPAGQLQEPLDIDALPISVVIDAKGRIHYQQRGALDVATVTDIIVPLIVELRVTR